MKKIGHVALAATLLCGSLLVSTDSAFAWKRGVNARQRHQQTRIYNGIQNGSLTQREAVRIQKREAKMARKEARMRQSGNGLNGKERWKLEKMEDHNSKAIYKQKHDGQGQ